MNENDRLTENKSASVNTGKNTKKGLLDDDDLGMLSPWDRLMMRFHTLPKRSRGIFFAVVVLVLVIACGGFIRKLGFPARHDRPISVPIVPQEAPAAEPVVEQGVDLDEDDEWIFQDYEEYETGFASFDDWNYEGSWEEGRNGAMIQRTPSGKYHFVEEADGTQWEYVYEDNGTFLYRNGIMSYVPCHLGDYEPVQGGEYWQKVKPVCFFEPVSGRVMAMMLRFYIDTELDWPSLEFDVYGKKADSMEWYYLQSFTYDKSSLQNGYYYVYLDENEISNLQSLYIVPETDEAYDDLKSVEADISAMRVIDYDYEY